MELEDAQRSRGNDSKPVSLLHTANSIVGDISDYPIYLLCSRPRLLLERTSKTDGTKHEFIPDPKTKSPFFHFSVGYEVPTYRNPKLPLPKWCTFNIDGELANLLKSATGSNSKVIRCEVPENHLHANVVSFVFEDGSQAAFYLSPDLWLYMRFELAGPDADNRIYGPLLQTILESPFNFQVHYVGQSKNVRARVKAHEKIVALTSHLDRNIRHEEPVIFVFRIENHDVPIQNDPKLHIDLVEACLIGSFCPHLNEEFTNFPMTFTRPKEVHLRNRLKRAGISRVTIDMPTPHKYVKVELKDPHIKQSEELWAATSMAMGEYYSVIGGDRVFWKDNRELDLSNI